MPPCQIINRSREPGAGRRQKGLFVRKCFYSVTALLLCACGVKGVSSTEGSVPPSSGEPAAVAPAADAAVESSGEVTCSPVVEGRKCGIGILVRNPTRGLIVVASISSDRTADETYSLLEDRYGSISDNGEGGLVFNGMAQMATPEVFSSRAALLLPGEERAYSFSTRFFRGERRISISYFSITKSGMSNFIFLPAAAGAVGEPSSPADMLSGGPGMDETFMPARSLEELDVEGPGAFVLWHAAELEARETGFALSPGISEAPFSMAAAEDMIPGQPEVSDVTYCDTFSAWVLRAAGSTWFVRESGAEELGPVGAAVFEKIDEKQGKGIRFKVPEDVFGKKYKLEEGDGMYTAGHFLTASGDDVLDVLRMLKQNSLTCFVFYYFFSSWYFGVSGG